MLYPLSYRGNAYYCTTHGGQVGRVVLQGCRLVPRAERGGVGLWSG